MAFRLQNCRKTAAAALLATFVAAASPGFAANATVAQTYTLPTIPLKTFQNTYLPGTISDDHGFNLGGVGSGIFKGPGDGPGVFWMITDRGPNPQTAAPVKRSFPVPTFTPFILKVKADHGIINILQAIPIVGGSGAVVTGLPNDPSASSPASPAALRDEQPYNCDVSAVIPGNPNGLDTEDLVRDVHGNFWVVDEYGPSIVKIASNGVVKKRFVPAGRESASGAGGEFTVVGNLPALLGRRPRNRGFEGLAITPNNKSLFAVIQSPLVNPTTAVGNPSRVVRIIEFDIPSESVVGEYAYVMQPVTDFEPLNGTLAAATEMKISGITALDQHRLLVLERTDKVAKIYKVDLRKATNILASQWDNPATSAADSLEALAQFVPAPGTSFNNLAAAGIAQLPKELVVDLGAGNLGLPQKIEGLIPLDGNTIAVTNDNDFQVGAPTCGANISSGVQSSIFIINLDRPIK